MTLPIRRRCRVGDRVEARVGEGSETQRRAFAYGLAMGRRAEGPELSVAFLCLRQFQMARVCELA